jgi:hypothetical protein
MHFLYTLIPLIATALANPVNIGGGASETTPISNLEARTNLPSSLPANLAALCPPTSNQQSNQCSTGTPYCCSPDGNGGGWSKMAFRTC